MELLDHKEIWEESINCLPPNKNSNEASKNEELKVHSQVPAL